MDLRHQYRAVPSKARPPTTPTTTIVTRIRSSVHDAGSREFGGLMVGVSGRTVELIGPCVAGGRPVVGLEVGYVMDGYDVRGSDDDGHHGPSISMGG